MAVKEEKETHEVKATPVAGRETTRTDIERTRGEIFVTPRADIYETDDALVLVADVPGAAKEGLEIKVEGGVLEITAHRKADVPKAEPDYAEYRPASYYRAFSLGDEIDAEKIGAKFADGVLTLTLPKSPKARPRKIEVEAE